MLNPHHNPLGKDDIPQGKSAPLNWDRGFAEHGPQRSDGRKLCDETQLQEDRGWDGANLTKLSSLFSLLMSAGGWATRDKDDELTSDASEHVTCLGTTEKSTSCRDIAKWRYFVLWTCGVCKRM
jgi:hypothetical protein